MAALIAAAAHAQCQPGWSALTETLLPLGYGDDVAAARSWPSGMPVLAVAGGFEMPPPIGYVQVVEFDGWRWSKLGAGVGTGFQGVRALAWADPALTPPALAGLYAGGDFIQSSGNPGDRIVRWVNGTWTEPGGGIPAGAVFNLAVHPSPNPLAIVATGTLQSPGTPSHGITRWDGATWHAFGSGLTWFRHPATGQGSTAFDDDGPGPRPTGLFVPGSFDEAGGVTAWGIAKWDGASWSSLGDGLPGDAQCARVFDEDGPGPAREQLYVGGPFNYAGGYLVYGLARWDSAEWSPVPGWAGAANVHDMEVFDDDGPGPRKTALFIGGIFSSLGSVPARHIVRWDGQEWSPLGTGLTGGTGVSFVNNLTVFDEDGPGPNPGGLYVAGNFADAGGVPTRGVARWGCPLPPRCDANCNKDFHPVTGQPLLTVADFGCFQTRFALQDPFADCNEDGALTVADFGCFQTKFATGCN